MPVNYPSKKRQRQEEKARGTHLGISDLPRLPKLGPDRHMLRKLRTLFDANLAGKRPLAITKM